MSRHTANPTSDRRADSLPSVRVEHNPCVGMEHRCGWRHPVHAVVTVAGPGGETSQGVLRDASISGAFVEMRLPDWQPFTTVQLRMSVRTPNGMRLHRWEAMIVRVTPRGIGLMFDELNRGLISVVAWMVED